MKSFFIRIVLISAVLTSCQSIAKASPTNTNLSFDDNNLLIFEPGLVRSAQSNLDTLSDASRYQIHYTINDDIASLTGTEDVHYTNREEVTLDEIQVRLLPNVLNGQMTVSSVHVNGQLIKPTYALNDSLLRISLSPGLPPSNSLNLSFAFSVKVPTTLKSNYGILAYYDGVLTLAHTYPMIAVYDDEGWNAEIPPSQGDPIYADASFFLVTIDAPQELTLVGSGSEINREKNGSRQIVTFAAGPARDFYVAASPDYNVTSKTVGEVTFNSYAPKKFQVGAQAALDTAIAAFQVYNERYAPYPYTEFDIVSTPTYALGIEYPGVIAIADGVYDMNANSYGMPNQTLMESVVAHEAGHQWFYNLVGNDQLDEPWLDESLTQFVTWQYYADHYGQAGANGFEGSLRNRWSQVGNETLPIGLPVAAYEGAAYNAIIYGRGALFFDALRTQIGTATFDTFMKDYVAAYSWGIGTTDNMKTLAEKDCGCNLTSLYKQWIYP